MSLLGRAAQLSAGAINGIRRHERQIKFGLSAGGGIVLLWFVVAIGVDQAGYDAYAYWSVDMSHLYDKSYGQVEAFGAFRYSPAAAMVMAPLGLLSWPVFLVLWTLGLVACLVWVARSWSLAACCFVGLPMSLFVGNVDVLIAAAVVMSFRRPWAWAVPILLKPTSAIGLLWYIPGRRFRELAIALGTVALASAPSVLLWPTAWADWLHVAADNASVLAGYELIPLLVRLPIAAVISLAGHPAVATGLSQPSFGLRSATVLLAAFREPGAPGSKKEA